ncbi:MAG: hypothetical protein AB8G26_03500 [Ilumatobacter sp.]
MTTHITPDSPISTTNHPTNSDRNTAMPIFFPSRQPLRDVERHLTRGRAATALVAGTLVLAACGGDPAPITAPAPVAAEVAADAPTTDAPAAAPADSGPVTPAATAGQSDLGEILVGEDGLTLYGFTNDVNAIPACYDACADAWPPVIVDEDWQVAPGLDLGIFATATRDDGQLQLVAGKWPLYFFAGDATAGDINGQGSGDVWFAVDTDGILITGDEAPAEAPAEEAAPVEESVEEAIVAIGSTDAGDVLIDANGLSLYGFTPDEAGAPTCGGACADAWPPLLVPSADLPAGLDPEIFSVVEGLEGGFQLKAGIWPLYTFAGDAAAGDINGQGSGGNWFLAAPDGSLITGEQEAVAADDAITTEVVESDDGYDY